MVKRMRSFFAVVMLVIAAAVNAQVTTSSMSGKVVDQSNEAIIGATIQAIHEPSGTHYGAITNVDGRYSIQGMRAGGPYKVEVSYVGYQSVVYKSINLQLGENYVLDANLKESTELLDEVVITASKSSNMKSDRAGAVTNVDAARMSEVPTVSRSMNDIMRLTPQGANIGSGFSVGGGTASLMSLWTEPLSTMPSVSARTCRQAVRLSLWMLWNRFPFPPPPLMSVRADLQEVPSTP